MSGAPSRLRIRTLVALYAASAIAMWVFGIASGAAETVGFRIELKACRAERCRPVPVPPSFWAGLYACQGRAGLIAQRAAVLPAAALRLPPGAWSFRARCAPVEGQRDV